MNSAHDIYLINQFPNFDIPGFNMERYNSLFIDHNVIINARSSNVEYDEHWGPLSIKCAFNGREFYRSGNRTIAVDDSSYLIFNEGKNYSSYIRSESKVESFTINFNPEFVQDVLAAMEQRDIDSVGRSNKNIHFIEKIYPHNTSLLPLLLTLRRMSMQLYSNKQRIKELFSEVLMRLVETQEEIQKEINMMSPRKYSTKQELYQRLNNAKDYMDACFADDLSLETIAHTAHLAPVYFLREFKKNYHLTPHQYLTQRRIEEAKYLLLSKHQTISEICLTVGFHDLSSFSKLFKYSTGFSPERYRSIIFS